MLIERDQLIAGRPAPEVRDLVRKIRNAVTATQLANRLGKDRSTLESFLFRLADEGYVEREVPRDRSLEPSWITTIKGNALAKARIGKPISREKAAGLLDEVLARVHQANDSDEWLHWIVRVWLYGSYAHGSGPVGDIDVAVALERRFEYEEFDALRSEMISRDGARLPHLSAELGYPSEKLAKFLRNRSSRIDLVGEERFPPGADPVLIFEWDPPTRIVEKPPLGFMHAP